jgi:hypothetical protein
MLLIVQSSNSLVGESSNSFVGEFSNSLVGESSNSLVGESSNSLVGVLYVIRILIILFTSIVLRMLMIYKCVFCVIEIG